MLAVALLILAGSVACSPPTTIDATEAGAVAAAFLAGGQPSSYVLEQVTVGNPQDGGSFWRVQVDALLRDTAHPQSQPLPIHAIVDVDKATGAARMFAQG
jgi:hypothetical protein